MDTHELRRSEENVEAAPRAYALAHESFFLPNQAFPQPSFHQASIIDSFPQNIQQAAYSSPGYFMLLRQFILSSFSSRYFQLFIFFHRFTFAKANVLRNLVHAV